MHYIRQAKNSLCQHYRYFLYTHTIALLKGNMSTLIVGINSISMTKWMMLNKAEMTERFFPHLLNQGMTSKIYYFMCL